MHGILASPAADSASRQTLPVIDTISRFYGLTADQMEQGYPVRLEGVVLYSDSRWKMIWFRDAAAVAFQALPDERELPPARTRAVFTGRTAMKDGEYLIEELGIQTLGPAELPAAALLTREKLAAGIVSGERAYFGGTVVDVETVDEHLRLIVTFQRRFQVRVYVVGADENSADNLIGAQVEVAGVVSYGSGDLEPGLAPVQLFVAGMGDMSVRRRGFDDPFAAPARELVGLRDQYERSPEAGLIRLRGKALELPATNQVVLGSGTNRVMVQLRVPATIATNRFYEAVGIAWRGGDEKVFLDRAVVRPTTANPPATAADSSLPTLETVQSVRGLTADAAARGYPVDFTGVVTYHDRAWRLTFVQDGTGGIYVDSRTRSYELTSGDRVRVRGHSDPGGFAPMVAGGEFEKLGTARLPAPREVAFGRLLSGAYDSHWIQLEGVVESASRVQDNLRLQLRHPGGGYQVVLAGAGATRETTNWVGSEVRFSGVCGVRANAFQQVTGIRLMVPGLDQVEFLSLVPDDPFAIPATGLDHLLRHSSEDEKTEQIRVTGIVTYTNASGLVALQEGSHGLFLHFPTNDVPSLASRIDVLGFPTVGSVAPSLRQTRWRKTEDVDPPAAQPLDMTGARTAEFVGRLVEIDATVAENHLDGVVPSLTLRNGSEVFPADFSAVKNDMLPPDIVEGTVVRVRGVHRVLVNEWNSARHFRLLVPPGGEIEVVSRPPWLTAERAGGVALLVGLVALMVTSWNLSLRSRVRQQSDLIRTEVEDKNRITAEYDELVRNADEMIVMMDAGGNVISLNPAAERVLGCESAELKGTLLAAQMDAESGAQLRHVLSGLKPEQPSAVIDLRLADARKSVAMEASFRLTKVPGAGTHVHCIARDVTERRNLETQVRQMQKMESVGQLAAGVAHDYNNLMTVVLGNAEFLMEDENMGREENGMVREIHEAADRAAGLTRQLLAFSRRQMIRPRKVDPGPRLRDLGNMLERLLGENIALEFALQDDLKPIRADFGMLEHAVVNLAVNGRDAMNGSGVLTISAKPFTLNSEDAARHEDALPGEYLRISVADTGSGISDADLPRVFEPFFTTKDVGEGTGLGLSTVFGIAKQHEGWVEIETEIEQGTTFHLFVPVWQESDGQSDPKAAPPQTKAVTKGRERVLLVEDERGVRDTMLRVLKRAGYEVSCAIDGAEGQSVWEESAGQFDVLVTDMIMPGEMSGRDLAERLRESKPDLKILYCTGYSAELTGLPDLDGQERLLPKPFENKILLEAVRGLLDGGNGSS